MSAQPSNMPEVTLPATALEAVDPPEIDPKTSRSGSVRP